MRRRELLRIAGGGLVAGAAGVARASAHDPYRPLGTVDVAGAKEAVVGPAGTTAYVAATTGFVTVDVSDPTDPRVLAEVREPLPDREGGPLRAIQDVKVAGDRLLVVGPANPAGDEVLQAALVYDVSDPAAPRLRGVHETDYPIHNACLADGRAYLTGGDRDREPLIVLDVTADPEEVGRWSLLDHDERWGDVSPWLRTLHDVWVHGDLAYCALWDAGTWIVDVADPTAPSVVGRAGGRSRETLADVTGAVGREVLSLPGNHHYAATDASGTLLAVGKEAWSSDRSRAPGGIDLWDVSDPASPTRRSRIPPPPTPDPSYGGTWTTAHNFDLGGGRLYSAWYQGGVKIHDVSDPASPSELAWWRRPEEAQFWTAQRARDCVVASDMGPTRGGDVSLGGAELYTFPDRPGVQPDPPSLTPTPSPTPTGAAGARTATEPTPAPTPTATEPTPTATGTPTDSPSPTPGETDDATPTGTTATPGQPGFGLLGTLAGVAGTALLAARRRSRGGRSRGER